MLLYVSMVSFCTVFSGIIQDSDSDFSICMLVVNTNNNHTLNLSCLDSQEYK